MYRNANNHPVQPLSAIQPKSERGGGGGEGGGETEGLRTASAASSSSASDSRSGVWGLNSVETNKLLLFCDIVLTHVNYPNAFLEQSAPSNSNDSEEGEEADESSGSAEEDKGSALKNERVSESPLNSVGESARESIRSSTSSTESVITEMDPEDVDKETFESVTCWCGKPFAGRPMIECDLCLVWYHMKCENVKKTSIPNEFHCSRCRDKKKRGSKKRCSKDTSPRRPAKRMSLEPKKSATDANTDPISPSSSPVSAAAAASRLNGMDTEFESAAPTKREQGSSKVTSKPVQSTKKAKSLSARSKKNKVAESRRKSSSNIPVNTDANSNSSNATLSSEACEGKGALGNERVPFLNDVPMKTGGGAQSQSQLPPVLTCYRSCPEDANDSQLRNTFASSSASHSGSASGSSGGEDASHFDNKYELGFSTIPVLMPEVGSSSSGHHHHHHHQESVIMTAGKAPSIFGEHLNARNGLPVSSSACLPPLSFMESRPSFQPPMGRSTHPVQRHLNSNVESEV